MSDRGRMLTPAQLEAAESWLRAFRLAMEAGDCDAAAAVLHPDGYWRDLLTLDWSFKTLHGVEEARIWLPGVLGRAGARGFRLEGMPESGGLGEHHTVELFFRFETHVAMGRGFVRLVADPQRAGALRALTLLTAMDALKGFPEAAGRLRPRGGWSAADEHSIAAPKGDPDVLIIGAGQSGLMMAARLARLDVRTLIVDSSARVGDVWRKRYRSLRLHNDVCMNHFPYLPFPEHWPVYLTRDQVADWMELYARCMELDISLSTTFLDGAYDRRERRWNVRLGLPDGSIRSMRPRHVIMAVGVSGIPSIAPLPGAEDFTGRILHSSEETGEGPVKDASVLVVGAGTSAHDIAQDMHGRGARVTMLQRSSVTVVSLEPSSVRAYEMYRRNDGVRPLADTDLMVSAVPYDLLRRLHGPLSRQMAADDRELLDGLRKVGFLLDNGEDDTGYFVKLLRYQAGYYLNVGASDLIVAGEIKLKAGVGIARLAGRSVTFTDGSAIEADMVVLATGFQPLQEAVRRMLGSEIADRVGPIWGIGSDGELCNMYARTPQEGFFVTGGGFMGARVYSRYTAMLIKADLEGLLPRGP